MLIRLPFEDALIELLLELLCQWCPVGAYRFQSFIHHLVTAIGAGDQTNLAFFTTLLGTANGRHQKA